MFIHGFEVSLAVTVMIKYSTGSQIVGLEVVYLELALNTIMFRHGIRTRYEDMMKIKPDVAETKSSFIKSSNWEVDDLLHVIFKKTVHEFRVSGVLAV